MPTCIEVWLFSISSYPTEFDFCGLLGDFRSDGIDGIKKEAAQGRHDKCLPGGAFEHGNRGSSVEHLIAVFRAVHSMRSPSFCGSEQCM